MQQVSELKVEGYQFFSRTSLPLGKSWSIKASSVQHPELPLLLTFEHVKKPFEMAFAQLVPQRPSIGPHQFVDHEVDKTEKGSRNRKRFQEPLIVRYSNGTGALGP